MSTKIFIEESCKSGFDGTDEQFEQIVKFLNEKFESGELYVIDVEDEDDNVVKEEI